MTIRKILVAAACAAGACFTAGAQGGIEYGATATVAASDGALAPYYMASNRYGTLTQGNSALLAATLTQRMDSTRRFGYGFGAELWGGWTSSASYGRYDSATGTLQPNSQHPARFWLQQLYGEIHYRSIALMVGQKERRGKLVDGALSSGDLLLSGNARPMPGAAIGLLDFRNIPFTRGWVQIDFEVGFYKETQRKWLEYHYNYKSDYVTTGAWFNYQQMHFRTDPSRRLSVTVGMQTACQFLGTQYRYSNGQLLSQQGEKASLKAFWQAILPSSGGSGSAAGDAAYYEGNHVGTWDLAVRYRISPRHQVRAYWQSPFEDGSGIGKLNGWDGLYGVEYRSSEPAIVTGAVVEYLTTMNQSGPIHWAPNDHPGTPITGQATGADSYYDNYFYNGFTQMGMSIGSPFVKSTLYNRDGYLCYTDSRMRGIHAAVTGWLSPHVAWRLMGSHRCSWGTIGVPHVAVKHGTSLMLEGSYRPPRVPGMAVKAQLALDRGDLYGNNFGALVSLTYSGRLDFNCRK